MLVVPLSRHFDDQATTFIGRSPSFDRIFVGGAGLGWAAG